MIDAIHSEWVPASSAIRVGFAPANRALNASGLFGISLRSTTSPCASTTQQSIFRSLTSSPMVIVPTVMLEFSQAMLLLLWASSPLSLS